MSDTPDTLADLLRSAGAWLYLAADELDRGDLDKAATFATLGRFGGEHTPERIAALTLTEVPA